MWALVRANFIDAVAHERVNGISRINSLARRPGINYLLREACHEDFGLVVRGPALVLIGPGELGDHDWSMLRENHADVVAHGVEGAGLVADVRVGFGRVLRLEITRNAVAVELV